MNSKDSITVKNLKIKDESSHCESTTDILNEDCLIHIFKFLTAKDRIKIERISKRWNRVAKLSWSSTKIFHLERTYSFEISNESNDTKYINFLIKVLKRSTNYLNEIILNSFRIKESSSEHNRFLKEVPKYLKNITKISIKDYDYGSFFKNNFLKDLFSIAENLSSISLEYMFISSECLLELRSNKIKELSIQKCYYESEKNFVSFLCSLKNLSKFIIAGFCYVETVVFKALEAMVKSNCENITEIGLLSDLLEPYNLQLLLSKQKKLRKVTFRGEVLGDSLMKNLPTEYLEELILYQINEHSKETILKHLHLYENLKILECEFAVLKDDDLLLLSKSINYNLKTVKINIKTCDLKSKFRSCFRRLDNLESFSLSYVHQYRDNKPISMDNILGDVAECKNLKYLFFQNCQISESMIAKVKTHPNNVQLEIK